MSNKIRFSLVLAAAVVTSTILVQSAFAAATADVIAADRVARDTVEVIAYATCDPLEGDSFAALHVTVFQGSYLHPNSREGQGGVGLEGVDGLVCDGTPHLYTFVVTLTDFFADKRFTPGPAGVEWSISVCTRIDPETTVCTLAGGPTQEQIKISP